MFSLSLRAAGPTQTAELTASDGTANAGFGSSVAIAGNMIVVGATGATVDGNPYQGAAYVFVQPADGWGNMTQTAKLTASDGTPHAAFGESVGIAGNTVVVGAPYAPVGSQTQQGAAYVFVEPSGARLTRHPGILFQRPLLQEFKQNRVRA